MASSESRRLKPCVGSDERKIWLSTEWSATRRSLGRVPTVVAPAIEQTQLIRRSGWALGRETPSGATDCQFWLSAGPLMILRSPGKASKDTGFVALCSRSIGPGLLEQVEHLEAPELVSGGSGAVETRLRIWLSARVRPLRTERRRGRGCNDQREQC